MHPMLNVLDDIAFVLECAATECMGDGKFELDLLIGRLQRDPAYAVEDKCAVADALSEVLSAYVRGDRKGAFSKLCRINRTLWASVHRS